MTEGEIVEAVGEYLGDESSDILLADGFEEAFLGIGQQFNTRFAIYDRDKCIEILCREMDEEQAEEYFHFNVENAWIGENTPVYLTKL